MQEYYRNKAKDFLMQDKLRNYRFNNAENRQLIADANCTLYLVKANF